MDPNINFEDMPNGVTPPEYNSGANSAYQQS